VIDPSNCVRVTTTHNVENSMCRVPEQVRRRRCLNCWHSAVI